MAYSVVRRTLLELPILGARLRGAGRRRRSEKAKSIFPGSASYWEQRYRSGGNSGVGSYGPVAAFKAEVLNEFVASQRIDRVLEFGCGDGHQLSMATYPTYVGLDVSRTAVDQCLALFSADPTKSFLLYDPTRFRNHGAIVAPMTMSLDVILHLVEDAVFDEYMRNLFAAATDYVVIFAEDLPDERPDAHVRYRPFLRWIKVNEPDWILQRTVENPLKGPDSRADFFFFHKS